MYSVPHIESGLCFPHQVRFDGKNPQCVMHALFRTQKELKEENGGRDVLSDVDVLNQSRGLIAAGRNTFLPPANEV